MKYHLYQTKNDFDSDIKFIISNWIKKEHFIIISVLEIHEDWLNYIKKLTPKRGWRGTWGKCPLVYILKNNDRMIVIYWPLPKPAIKRCTCVNKWKNSGGRWTLSKNIDRVLGAVGQLRQKCQSENQLADWRLWALSDPRLNNPSRRCERSAAMVKRWTWVSLTVGPCLHSPITHNRTSSFRK